jgi:hypothetical protein
MDRRLHQRDRPWREIRTRGCPGGSSSVRDYLARFRGNAGASAPAAEPPKPRTVTAWIMTKAAGPDPPIRPPWTPSWPAPRSQPVIPLTTSSWMMLQRNLLYTRVTWARKLIVLAGSRQALAASSAPGAPAAPHRRGPPAVTARGSEPMNVAF